MEYYSPNDVPPQQMSLEIHFKGEDFSDKKLTKSMEVPTWCYLRNRREISLARHLDNGKYTTTKSTTKTGSDDLSRGVSCWLD